MRKNIFTAAVLLFALPAPATAHAEPGGYDECMGGLNCVDFPNGISPDSDITFCDDNGLPIEPGAPCPDFTFDPPR